MALLYSLLYSLTLGHAVDEHLSRHFALNLKVLHAHTLGILVAQIESRVTNCHRAIWFHRNGRCLHADCLSNS